MKKDLTWITENIKKDFEKASIKEIDKLYDELKSMLKKYDNDPILKDIKDWFKKIFKSKKERCIYIFNDIIEEINESDFNRKEELRKDLLKVSNIHRDFLENLISLLESL